MPDRFLDPTIDFETEYSPSSEAADFMASVGAYRSRSDALTGSYSWWKLPYGNDEEEFVILSGELREANHVHLFIHGGYWQELSWRDALFPALGFVDAGYVYGALNYSLAPALSLEGIIEQCRSAVVTVIGEIDVSRVRISLSGSSAGAHLAATLAMTDWDARGLSANPIAALILLSGIYDLRPLTRTSINDALGLDELSARLASPLLRPAAQSCPALVAWGQYETAAFKKQSAAFAEHWRKAGNRVSTAEIAGRSHFDVVFDLSDPVTDLGHRVYRLLQDVCQ